MNEIVEESGKRSAMVVTSDENGKVLSREPVPEELIGEFYRNLISEDFVDEN